MLPLPVSKRAWLMLAVLFVSRTCAGYAFQAVGSSGPAIAASLAIDFALIGTLIGLFKLPGIVLSIPSGALAGLAGERVLITLGLGVMALGTAIMAMATGFVAAAAGRVIAGCGFVIANLYFTKATIDWFAGSTRLALAMGILVSSWPLGISLGLTSQPAMTVALGWQSTMLLAAALAAVSTVLMVVLYREAPARTVPPQTGLAALKALSPGEWRDISLIGLVWGMLNVGLAICAGFVPALLTSLGVDLASAGRLVSIAMWSSLVAIPAVGYLASAIGGRTIIVACTIFSTAVYAALAFSPTSTWLYVVYGFACAGAAGPIMAQPTSLLQPANRAAGMGVFYTIYYLTMGALPPKAGWLRDVTGPQAPILFAALLMGLSLVAQVVLWGTRRTA